MPAMKRRRTTPGRLRFLIVLLTTLVMAMSTVSPAAAKPKNDIGKNETPAVNSGPGSLATVASQVGADDLWAQGLTGEGVHVAVIDTGVAPVPALSGEGSVVALVDLSFEAGDPDLAFRDNYGHGTHLAGIIAGDDPVTGFSGIAPGAGIVSVKVGNSSGAVDVSQVIAGIDWTIAHRNTDGLNIRVINLAYGTDGVQDYEIDPLSHAVERAWNAGIVVVVAAGNDGRPAKGLSNPARDPFVIAVGAAEIKNDKARAAKFSTSGNGDRNPDLVAPGVSIESLRVPGSFADTNSPDARVGDDLFRGTGSSQASAVVSGSIALLLEARPELSPDQVKALLIENTEDAKSNKKFVGHGLLDIASAAAAATPGDEAIQTWPLSNGSGTLEAARGSQHVSLDGHTLEGEVTFTGQSWDEWQGAGWYGAGWYGAGWYGAGWYGAGWYGAGWYGAGWYGAGWYGAGWYGAGWYGAGWYGAGWYGAGWYGAGWYGADWG